MKKIIGYLDDLLDFAAFAGGAYLYYRAVINNQIVPFLVGTVLIVLSILAQTQKSLNKDDQ